VVAGTEGTNQPARRGGAPPAAIKGWALAGALALAAAGPAGVVVAAPAGQVAAECAIPAPVAVATPAATPLAGRARAASPAPAEEARSTDRARRGATPIRIAPRREAPAAPEQTAEPAATNPEDALARELTDVAAALAACLADGDDLVATLATENYLGQLYGGGEPLPREEYLALAEGIDPVPTRIRSLRDVEVVDAEDEASAEVVSIVGNQLLRSRWFFVRAPRGQREPDESPWRVDGEELLPFDPPADADEIGVALEEYAIGLDQTEVAGPDVVLDGRNGGAEEHEMLVLRLDDGATVADLLRGTGPGLPDGISYVGQTVVRPGEEAQLVLVDLDPGTYAVVCLFPTERGTPHVALGMEATFEVTG